MHGAGVLADRLIADQTDDQFLRVFRTKVSGLQALLSATRGDALSRICLFSSVAARYGNAGQAAYVAANEVLNKVARAEAARRGAACHVMSLNWGPWDGGMVTPALRSDFERRGIPLIALSAGTSAFVAEMLGSELGEGAGPVGGDPRRSAAQDGGPDPVTSGPGCGRGDGLSADRHCRPRLRAPAGFRSEFVVVALGARRKRDRADPGRPLASLEAKALDYGCPTCGRRGGQSERSGRLGDRFESVFDSTTTGLAPALVTRLDPLVAWLLHAGRAALTEAGVPPGDASLTRAGAVFGHLAYPTGALAEFAEAIWLGQRAGRIRLIASIPDCRPIGFAAVLASAPAASPWTQHAPRRFTPSRSLATGFMPARLI